MADLTPEQLDEIERRAKAALEFKPTHEPDTAPGWESIGGWVEDGGQAAFGRTHVYEDDSSEEEGAQVDSLHIAASSPTNVLSLIAEVRRLRAGIPDGVLQVERTTLTAALVYLTAEINQYRSKSNVPSRIRRAQELLEHAMNEQPQDPNA